MPSNARILPLVVASALFMEQMDSTIIATSLPAMAADLGVSPTSLKLAFTTYLLGLTVVLPVSGWAADRFGAVRTLRVQLAVLAAMMALVPLTQGNYWLSVLVFVVWGVAGFGLTSPQQMLLASHAPQQAPLVLSLNGSMLYVGTALGALISGAFIDTLGFARLGWVGLPFVLVAWITLTFDTA